MSSLNNLIFDNGLSYLTSNTEKFYLLSDDPALTWADIATYALASKSPPTVASPSNRSGGGREVIISAISDGSVTATGTATHFALTDDSETVILASGDLDAPLAVTNGGIFATDSFTIGIPGLDT